MTLCGREQRGAGLREASLHTGSWRPQGTLLLLSLSDLISINLKIHVI